MEALNKRLLAKYPFLPEVREYLKGIELDEILKSPVYETARELAYERIRASILGKPFAAADDDDLILSFVIAKMILMAMDDKIIVSRFANSERDRFERFAVNEDYHTLKRLADFFDLKIERIPESEREVNIHFISFIKYSTKFSTDDFRLIFQPLKKGWFPVSVEKFVKIMREAFVEKLIEEIQSGSKKPEIAMIKKHFSREIELLYALKDEYISSFTPADFGNVVMEAFPPCIKTIIAKIKSGVNISHQARFTLVAFLHRIGMSNDEILGVFASVPDFKESLTRYQIEHITGKISGKDYNVPKCMTMVSYGLCVKDIKKDPLCEKKWMTHPLLYYRIKKKGVSRPSKSSESQSDGREQQR